MNCRFDGKKALVTGSGRGIGRGIAVALYERGATVFALSRTQESLDTLKTQCPNITTVCVDLSDWSATRNAVKSLGHIDLLVNNAGTGFLSSVLETDEESYDRIMNVNVKAVFNVSQIVAQGMKDRGTGGSIVNISSQAGLRAHDQHLAYCSSKAALNMMTKCMALELGPYEIRTNAVCPTVVLTDLGRAGWSDPEKSASMMKRIPLGRFAEVEDCVSPVLFLLSDDSSMVNGTEFPVDGGFCV